MGAEFTVNDSSFDDLEYEAEHDEVLELTLEDPSSIDASRVVFSVVATSEDAPALTFSPSTGIPTTPTGTVTVTMPSTGTHSYMFQCQVNEGRDASGRTQRELTKRRVVAIRSGNLALRKLVPGETTEAHVRGWTAEQNAAVDAIDAAGGGGGGGSGVPPTRTISAGSGLTGGGDLSANRTLHVAATDPSIDVTADGIAVGVLQNDAQHGNLGGGELHDLATDGIAGFMSPEHYALLDTASVTAEPSTLVRRSGAGEIHLGVLGTAPSQGTIKFSEGEGNLYTVTPDNEDSRIIAHSGLAVYVGDINAGMVLRTKPSENVLVSDGTGTIWRLLTSGSCTQPGDLRRDGTTGQLYTYRQGVGETPLSTGATYWEKDFGVTTALTGGVRYLHPGVGTSSTAISVMRAHVACTITSMNIVVGIAGTGTSTWTFTLVKATPAGSTYTPVATSMTTSFLVTELGASVTGSVSLAAGEYFAIQYLASSGTSASPQSLVGTLRFEGV